jgi:uncharacterized protein
LPVANEVDAMKIEVHHIPSQGVNLDFERPVHHFSGLKELIDNGECEFLTPLAINLEVMPIQDFFQVKGHIRTNIRQACVRCLEDFDSPLKSSFTLNYSKAIPSDIHAPDEDGIELTADQIGMIFFEGEEIDFKDALHEQMILAIPYKPLCKADCKGLCAQCGQDLNTGPCQCSQKPAEGPFAVLKDLKLSMPK